MKQILLCWALCASILLVISDIALSSERSKTKRLAALVKVEEIRADRKIYISRKMGCYLLLAEVVESFKMTDKKKFNTLLKVCDTM